MGTAVLSSIVTTMIWVCAHLMAMRRRPARGRFAAMSLAWTLSLPVLLTLLAALNHNRKIALFLDGNEDPLLSWLDAVFLHCLLFFLFVECFYHIERSVTLRLLTEIHRASAGNLPIDTILNNYSVDDMIYRRLDDLERGGFASRHGEKWILSSKGRMLALLMGFSCRIFKSRPQNERM